MLLLYSHPAVFALLYSTVPFFLLVILAYSKTLPMLFWARVNGKRNNVVWIIFYLLSLFCFCYFLLILRLIDMNAHTTRNVCWSGYCLCAESVRTCPLMHQLTWISSFRLHCENSNATVTYPIHLHIVSTLTLIFPSSGFQSCVIFFFFY